MACTILSGPCDKRGKVVLWEKESDNARHKGHLCPIKSYSKFTPPRETQGMKNMYKTKAREEIIAYLKEHAEQRFTAREIFEATRKGDVEINRTTVYRNLDRLCETGDLLKYKEPNQDAWYYQYSSGHDHCDKHMHAQCSVCGKIFHLDEPFAKAFGDKLLEVCGLDVEPAKTIILGKCSECRGKKK